ESLFCRRYRFRVGILWSACCIAWQKYIGIGESSVGQRVLRIYRNCLLKVLDRFLQIVTGPLVPEKSSLQIKLICFVILSRSRYERLLLRAAQLCLQSVGDGFRNLALDGKYIV